ncbi:hypothetical protein LZ30DRAFT_685299 [Colletotrichum cereale]|nr:hypothetical protein LZ30DRAFT_685299 [Colletotrichum cereale]
MSAGLVAWSASWLLVPGNALPIPLSKAFWWVVAQGGLTLTIRTYFRLGQQVISHGHQQSCAIRFGRQIDDSIGSEGGGLAQVQVHLYAVRDGQAACQQANPSGCPTCWGACAMSTGVIEGHAVAVLG